MAEVKETTYFDKFLGIQGAMVIATSAHRAREDRARRVNCLPTILKVHSTGNLLDEDGS